jgi:hypothetical protein
MKENFDFLGCGVFFPIKMEVTNSFRGFWGLELLYKLRRQFDNRYRDLAEYLVWCNWPNPWFCKGMLNVLLCKGFILRGFKHTPEERFGH